MRTRVPGWALSCLPLVAFAADPASGSSDSPAARNSAVPGIEITELISQVAKRTGRQFIVDPRVRGEVPLPGLDADRIDYRQLTAILRINQYVAYESGGLVNVIPDANARQKPTTVGNTVNPKTPDDELVTVVVEVKNACVVHLVPILRPLMPQAAHLAAIPQASTLVISDYADNARRVMDLIERLDRLSPDKEGCPQSADK
jgi:general secretion pathway protein D